MNTLQLAFWSHTAFSLLLKLKTPVSAALVSATWHGSRTARSFGRLVLCRARGLGAGGLKRLENIIIFVNFPHIGGKKKSHPVLSKTQKWGEEVPLRIRRILLPLEAFGGPTSKLARDLSRED